MLKLAAIDMDLLTMAMDGPEFGDVQWWIDPATGQLDMTGDAVDGATSEDLDERGWIPVKPVGSHQGYRDMEDFIDRLEDGPQREALLRAIGQRRPFRHFKDALHAFEDLPSRWHAFHDTSMLDQAVAWLVARGLVDEADAGNDAVTEPPPGPGRLSARPTIDRPGVRRDSGIDDGPTAAIVPREGTSTMPAAQRLSIQSVDPAAYQPMLALEKYIHAGGLGEDLLALVKIRASQINGCAFCLDMHGREARTAGVDDRRLDVLAGWHEAPDLYSPRERAALALTEEVTLIGEGGVSDETWADAAAAFSEQDLTVLIMAICAINSWNRMAIATRQALPDLPAADHADTTDAADTTAADAS